MLYSDVAYSVNTTGISTVGTVAAYKVIQSGFDRLNRVDGFDQDPDLDHVASLGVTRTGGEPGCDDDTVRVLM